MELAKFALKAFMLSVSGVLLIASGIGLAIMAFGLGA